MKRIPLTRGMVALVDDDDYEKHCGFKWHAVSCCGGKIFYARRRSVVSGKVKMLGLHRQIMGEPIGRLVDHKNHDTLDCRKDNLRVCTKLQNCCNKSGPYKNSNSNMRGIRWERNKFWRVRVGSHGKIIHVGCFRTKTEAIEARRLAGLRHHGEFAGALS